MSCLNSLCLTVTFIVSGGALRPWCISPRFRFPPISEKCSDFLKILYNFTFSRKISWLSSTKISDDLFSRKLFFPPTFTNFPFCFRQIHPAFYILYVYCPLLWPWCIYASPNARTGRPCLLSHNCINIEELYINHMIQAMEALSFS